MTRRGALPLLLLVLPSANCSLASLRLITFDLDDTLWPTGPVVSAANTALAKALQADTAGLQNEACLLYAKGIEILTRHVQGLWRFELICPFVAWKTIIFTNYFFAFLNDTL